ncbi:hypothetical protein NQ318_017586, partial [Aromia moschata]
MFPTCESSTKYTCPVDNMYLECVETDDGSYYLVIRTCPSRQIFDESILECIVEDSSSSPSSSTATSTDTTESSSSFSSTTASSEIIGYFPKCTSTRKYTCPVYNMYYECVETDDEHYELLVKTCPSLQIFDENSLQCIVDESSVTIPTCTGPGKYPCPINKKYYECVESDEGDYQLVVRTCSSGDIFDRKTLDCVTDNTDMFPTCESSTKYTCPVDNMYFGCVETDDGSYYLVVRTCPSRQIFDESILECIVEDSSSSLSSSTATSKDTTGYFPRCTSIRNYTCPVYNMYYECVEVDDGYYELLVKTCPSLQIFDENSLQCIVDKSSVTIPTCAGPGKYPCPITNKYYECVESDEGDYQLVVRTCSSEEIFDRKTLDCVPDNTDMFPTCESSTKYTCPVDNMYFECVETDDGSYYRVVRTCPSRQIFDGSILECIVEDSSSTLSSSTAISTDTTGYFPKCTSTRNYTCHVYNMYYECVEVDDGYYEMLVKTCPSLQIFDENSLQCIVDKSSVTIPTCTGPGKYPCPIYNKYYECVESDEGDYQLVVRTCSSGEIFDRKTLDCVLDNTDMFPTCESSTKYTCPVDNMYFECVETDDGSFYLVVRTCPPGQIFDESSLQCTTRGYFPKCTSTRNYTCPVYNMYYKCVETDDGSYEMLVKTCPSLQIFDENSLQCIVDESSVTVPTCTGPDKYPCPISKKYYECVESDEGDYQLVVRTCSSGEIFDRKTLDCVPDNTDIFLTCESSTKYMCPVNNMYFECVETDDGSYDLVVKTCPSRQIFDESILQCTIEGTTTDSSSTIQSTTETGSSLSSSSSSTSTEVTESSASTSSNTITSSDTIESSSPSLSTVTSTKATETSLSTEPSTESSSLSSSSSSESEISPITATGTSLSTDSGTESSRAGSSSSASDTSTIAATETSLSTESSTESSGAGSSSSSASETSTIAATDSSLSTDSGTESSSAGSSSSSASETSTIAATETSLSTEYGTESSSAGSSSSSASETSPIAATEQTSTESGTESSSAGSSSSSASETSTIASTETSLSSDTGTESNNADSSSSSASETSTIASTEQTSTESSTESSSAGSSSSSASETNTMASTETSLSSDTGTESNNADSSSSSASETSTIASTEQTSTESSTESSSAGSSSSSASETNTMAS